jgi:hypothetical protein
MEENKRIPAITTSESVSFLLRGAQKRRSMALARAKMIQCELGVVPRLITVK